MLDYIACITCSKLKERYANDLDGCPKVSQTNDCEMNESRIVKVNFNKIMVRYMDEHGRLLKFKVKQ